MGAFGLLGDPNPTHFPSDRFVEANLRLSIWQALEQGMLADGTVTRVVFEGDGGGPPGIQPVEIRRESPHVWIDETRVLVTWHSPNPHSTHPFFECPACGRRCRHVYLRDRVACRRCHRLDWACRHVNRQMPSAARVARLRRRLGATDTRPFAPLPPRRRGQKRAYYERLVDQIHDEEVKLVAYLGSIVYDLDRRLRGRRGPKRHDRIKATPRSDTA